MGGDPQGVPASQAPALSQPMLPIVEAILRAFVGGLLTGAMTGLTTYATIGQVQKAGVAGGVACLGYWIVRGGFEGVADQVRS